MIQQIMIRASCARCSRDCYGYLIRLLVVRIQCYAYEIRSQPKYNSQARKSDSLVIAALTLSIYRAR